MHPLRLNLDFYHPWTNNVGLYLARNSGLLKSQEIDLSISTFDPFRGDALDALLEGHCDFAISYPNRFLRRVELGHELVTLFALNQEPLECVVTRADADPRDWRTLLGKKIAFRRSERMPLMMEYFAQLQGLALDQFEVIEFFPNEPMGKDLASGEIDAMFGALMAWEGLLGPPEAVQSFNFANFSELGAAKYPAQVVVTTRANWEANPKVCNDFVKCCGGGYTQAYLDADATVQTALEAAPYFERATFEQSYELVKETWAVGEEWGKFDLAGVASYQQWLIDRGLLDQKVELEPLFIDWEKPPLG
jgi:ABC-type nitrate/sulfonate/bicarbonate transport system substrate-binding protein